LQLHTKTM